MKKIFLLIILCLIIISCGNDRKEKIIIKKIFNNYDNYIYKGKYMTKIYYKEFAQEKDKYIMFNEGVGYLISYGYDCEIPLDNFSIIFENFRKSDRKNEWLEYLEYLYRDAPVKYQSDIEPGYNSLLNSFRRVERNLLLNKNSFFNYKFKFKNYNRPEYIEFQSSSNDFKGRIKFSEKYLIQEIFLDTCTYYCQSLRTFVSAKMYIRYNYFKNKCFFDSISLKYSNDSLQLQQNIIITVLDKKYIEDIKLEEEDYRVSNIQDVNPYIVYDKKKWESYKLPIEYDNKLIKDLEENSSEIENQFKNNSNKNYYISEDLLGVKEDTEKINISSKKLLERLSKIYYDKSY